MTNTTRKTAGLKLTRRGARGGRRYGVGGHYCPVAAFAADKVILRTNWLFYGSRSVFFLGIDKGLLRPRTDLDVVVKQGNGSGNTGRLVANKDTTCLRLGRDHDEGRGPGRADRLGGDDRCHRDRRRPRQSDSGIKTFKDLEGKKVLTTAGAGVNTMF